MRLHSAPGSVEGVARVLARRHCEAIAGWLDASPDKSEPLAAMAEALERLGDKSALDTLRRARALTRDSSAVSDWRWRRCFSNSVLDPEDAAGMRRGRAMAESLLFAPRMPQTVPFERAALAALTGAAFWR